MRRPYSINPVELVVLLSCLLGSMAAYSLSTDKDQPIQVEADEAELDDLNDVSIYRGNVIVTQGSIRMTGDVMTVRSKGSNGLDYLVIEGSPATYRQLPDNAAAPNEARAKRMEYHKTKNLVVLIEDAWVKQDTSTLVGERIEYNTELSRVKATGGVTVKRGAGDGESDSADPTKKRGRVKLILKKKDPES